MSVNLCLNNFSSTISGDNCCISQDVYFCTGNHNYKKKEFDLMSEPIVIGDNCWIGAKSILCPGVNMQPNTIVKINTVVKKNY